MELAPGVAAAWTAAGARSPSAATDTTAIVSHRFTEILLSLGVPPLDCFPPQELRLRRGLLPRSAYARSRRDRCDSVPFYGGKPISSLLSPVALLLTRNSLPSGAPPTSPPCTGCFPPRGC